MNSETVINKARGGRAGDLCVYTAVQARARRFLIIPHSTAAAQRTACRAVDGYTQLYRGSSPAAYSCRPPFSHINKKEKEKQQGGGGSYERLVPLRLGGFLAQRMGFARYLSKLPYAEIVLAAPACILLLYQAALDPSGTNYCISGWGSGSTDYCSWNRYENRQNQRYIQGVLCGGCSEEDESFLRNGWYDFLGLGCPMDSSHPSRVTYLHLFGCLLEGSMPWSLLGQLTRLQVLNLWGNPLTGTALAEEGLATLTQLRFLSLGWKPQCQLSGTVPVAALGGLAQLRYLDLGSTQVDAAQCHSFCDPHMASTFNHRSDRCRCP
eukprot:SAG31_NODE_9704_length_1240_cov_0.892200_2_plen_323_part_00